MDVLRADAEQLLEDLPIASCNNQYATIHIKFSGGDHANTTFEDRTLSDADLRTFVDCSTPRSDIISTKIVQMHYQSDPGTKSLSSLFRHIWCSFQLDPYMIHMFSNNVPGFFQLPSTAPGKTLLNFYANCQAHWLLWAYDPSTFSTNAILLSRSSPGGRAAYPAVHAQLKRYSVLAPHPLFLALVTALERVAYVDIFLKEQHRRVGRAERHTGFSHFFINRPRPQVEDAEAELAQLSNLSRLASSVLVGLADMVQHLQAATAIVELALSFSLNGGMQGVDEIVSRDAEIKNIAGLLDPQLKQRFGYVGYIKDRAENQLTVLFNLLARGDAQANIEIAKSAKHDSTSMKTIAIMTMVFLPATFFAALFAVPSLHWDRPTVVDSRFWVYWAVTIPTTVSVFAIWSGIMHWDRLMKQREALGRQKRTPKMPSP